MFTGIIETLGTVAACSRGALRIRPDRSLKGLSVGESVSIDGVCLTLDKKNGDGITFRLLPETVRATTLGALRPGNRVNLERALRVRDRLGGHLLLGHVDGQGKIVGRTRQKKFVTLRLQVPAAIAACLVPKGPIGIDGVSLTLDPKISRGRIGVHLIPHTAQATGLAGKPLGARVNIELDLIAKYLRGMLY